ncbi:inversin isoform X1 [Grus americana]|uniref:inversin isoform X1 n=3 Tax=Grus americana TaxID=9117 RepID=UPI0024084C08|nr:inversin isoform X1 [Grus americana]XP_054670199.1 inversin isoform X1 [Grus americana]XP_054670200.1 inversin isoform X1 [Grus americana]XP_054670201.1 inversin isoform X1 [Grus americana]
MNISASCLFSGSSLASEVHAAAVNGDKSTLQKLIAGNSELKDKEDQFGRTPLMYCVLADRLDCAEALLKAGADVNRADRSRRTALHLAAQKGNYRFMKLLLARRGNWMQKDLEDMTPLHLTTRHKSPKCLALLLKHMAPGEVDTQDRNKQTALHWSAYYNNPEHVKLLIKHDSNIGIPDIEGKIPLHWAANNKDPSAIHTVKCILEAAPTESLLNWQDYEGRTPLHFAVADGNVAVVDVLTSYEGCNVTSYDNLFRTPLHWAALLGHAQIVHLLLERNKFGTIPSDSQGATPLHYAAQSNFAETVEVFLKHPSVKDDSDLEGRTSFMWAAGKGSDDVIRTMLALKLDIDINMTDKYAGTALHAAALSGHVSTVKLLLEHNAQVDALDVMKHTPLFRACEMGHKEVIQTLIKGGARVDLVDQDGHSPLHWAALGGNADVCQILIENKINPNVQDYAGRTPLQCAAYGGYINCMVVLLENNADPNIQDKEGRTALHWLCNNGYLDAIKLLLGFDAFPNHMESSEERYTPLDYALLGEHHEVIQFMLEHGALSIAAIQDIAAFKIQAVYKGYKVRKAFQERKNLLMKHEQLRKDAAAKKREEESKRKEAKLQKGMQNVEQNTFRVQQNPANREKTTSVSQLSNKPSDIQSKSPLSLSASQIQPGRNSRGSPKVCHNKGTPKESGLSAEPQSEGHKIKQDSLRKHLKSKSSCVHFHCGKAKEGTKVEAKHQVAAATELDGEKHKEHTIEATSTSARRSRRHTSAASRTASVGEKLRDQSQSSSGNRDHCEGTAVFFCDVSCTGGIARNSKQCEASSKGKRHQQKSRNKEVNDERCSPAGSSRPGSAKTVFVNTKNDSVHAVEQTNKVGNYELAKKASPLLSAEAEPTGRVPRNPAACSASNDSLNLEKTGIIGSRNADDQLCSVAWQSTNIELIPLEIRMQIIEKERKRKELFRKKNYAATVIQRTWRSYQLRQELFQLLSAKRQCKEDEDKWRQETAAFFIQVAWKKQLNHSPLKSVPSCKNLKSINKTSSAIKTSKQSILKQIYGRSQEGKACQPTRPPSKLKLSDVQLVSVNNLHCVNLLENMGKSKQFSYNMRPTTAAKSKSTRLKH